MSFTRDSSTVTEVVPSPNHDARTSRIDILLMHYTGMTTEEEALARLTDLEAKVSSHYFVYEDGRIAQLVPEALRAWHAGASSWKGATDINSRSIGIEIANPGHEYGYRDFPQRQIEAAIALCRDIVKRHSIPRERVLAHSDVAPARKNDPGERFPWARLAAAGVGLWVEAAPIASGRTLSANDRGSEVEDLQRKLIRFGYGLEVTRFYDDATRNVVTAFQRHFRPERVDGLADPSTIETLKRLLTASRPLH
jgi:N-acetylmuramoyl-L-alanine amidase